MAEIVNFEKTKTKTLPDPMKPSERAMTVVDTIQNLLVPFHLGGTEDYDKLYADLEPLFVGLPEDRLLTWSWYSRLLVKFTKGKKGKK